jgi:hypothetical protein
MHPEFPNPSAAESAIADIRAYAEGRMPSEYCGDCIAQEVLAILERHGY